MLVHTVAHMRNLQIAKMIVASLGIRGPPSFVLLGLDLVLSGVEHSRVLYSYSTLAPLYQRLHARAAGTKPNLRRMTPGTHDWF